MPYQFIAKEYWESASTQQKKQQVISFIEEFERKMKKIEEMLLDYLDKNEDNDVNYQLLIDYLNEIKISQNKADLKLFFHLIVQVSNNHHRSHDFFTKINKILTEYQNITMEYFSTYDIFNIFKSNKQILLFLFKNKTIQPNQAICNIILSNEFKEKNYPNYFIDEIKSFLDEKMIQKYIQEDLNEFERKRKIGENDNKICEFIRKDAVIDFISHVNHNNYPLNSNINESIYETNEFLINNTPSLIEYASFYGSIQIFRYLVNNNVQMTPSLWLYAIHGRNPDIIHLLEENHITPITQSFDECYKESIICHHNEITNYIENNLLTVDKKCLNLLKTSLKYYNFNDVPMINNDNYNDYFLYSCKYDFISIFDFFCKSLEIDASSKITFQSKFKDKIDSLLNIVVRKGYIEILQILLSRYKMDMNDKYVCTITDIETINDDFYYNNYEIVTETTVEITPLIFAVENGNFEIIKLLTLNTNIDINANSLFQIENYHREDNEKFEKSQKKHQENRNALIISIENNLYDIFTFLLSQKIDTKYAFTQIDSCYRGYSNDGSCELENIYEEKEEKNILIIAIEKGYFNYVQQLLSIKSIDPNSKLIKLITFSGYEKDYEEKSALIIAIENENIEIVRLLISRKETNVNTNQINRYDRDRISIENNALIIATQTKNPEIVELLLSRCDIDVNAKYIKMNPVKQKYANYDIISFQKCLAVEKTALFTAVELECVKIVELLLSKPETMINSKLINIQTNTYINKNKYYELLTEYKSEFIAAIEKLNFAIVQLFLQRKDVDVNFISTLSSDTNIYRYSESENCKSESYLKFEKKKEEKTALHIAAQNNDFNIIQSLLSNSKIDVNSLLICNKEQTYIQAKKNKNKSLKKTALHIAIENQNLEIIRLLLSMKEIDVNASYIKNSNLYEVPIIKTPIMIAVEKGDKNIIKLFLNNEKVKIPNDLMKSIQFNEHELTS